MVRKQSFKYYEIQEHLLVQLVLLHRTPFTFCYEGTRKKITEAIIFIQVRSIRRHLQICLFSVHNSNYATCTEHTCDICKLDSAI